MRALILATVLLAPAMALAAPKHKAPAAAPQGAVMLCGKKATVLDDLLKHNHETQVWAGATDYGKSFIVTQSPDGKTWTLLGVQGAGEHELACFLAVGAKGAQSGGDAGGGTVSDEHV